MSSYNVTLRNVIYAKKLHAVETHAICATALTSNK